MIELIDDSMFIVFQTRHRNLAQSVISEAGGDYEVVEIPFPLFDGLGKKAASLFGVVEIPETP